MVRGYSPGQASKFRLPKSHILSFAYQKASVKFDEGATAKHYLASRIKQKLVGRALEELKDMLWLPQA